MAGRHRRSAVHHSAPKPPRVWLTGIVDGRTGVEHWMTDEGVAVQRDSGRFLALCGEQVLGASLTAPPRRQCRICTGGGAR